MSASPKFINCSSPARVRHNPYASPSSPYGTPSSQPTAAPFDRVGTPQQTSLSTSFASVPPMTPPQISAPAVYDFTGKPNIGAVPFVPSFHSAFEGAAMPQQASFYSDVSTPVSYQPAYDAVDPAVAVMMYNAASAAANAAACGMYAPTTADFEPRAAQVNSRKPHHPGESPVPTFEDLQAMEGTLVEQARTASGSSFIQSAVKDSNDPRCVPFVWAELSPALADLLLDAHGCYVIKTLMERLSPMEITYVLQCIAADEQLGFSICTHSLHTRRVVQHIIENIDHGFLCELMSRHCADVAMTQQGCIVMQRSMDHAPEGPSRDKLFAAITFNLVAFAKDPFANYVVQHLMEVGDRVATADAMWKAFQGRVVELACNKFASNVIEKCLFHCTADVQHEILVEMYSVGPQMLYNMLQDSFGNYIIQSSIALATFRDVSLIDEKLRPVLAHTPYGYKIEGRLERRLKGKPVSTRTPPPVPTELPVRQAPAAGQGPLASKPRRHPNGARGPVPAGETPW